VGMQIVQGLAGVESDEAGGLLRRLHNLLAAGALAR
jgi:hypothetical protein